MRSFDNQQFYDLVNESLMELDDVARVVAIVKLLNHKDSNDEPSLLERFKALRLSAVLKTQLAILEEALQVYDLFVKTDDVENTAACRWFFRRALLNTPSDYDGDSLFNTLLNRRPSLYVSGALTVLEALL